MAPIPIANIYFAIDVNNLVSLIKKGFGIMVSQYGGIKTLNHKKTINDKIVRLKAHTHKAIHDHCDHSFL